MFSPRGTADSVKFEAQRRAPKPLSKISQIVTTSRQRAQATSFKVSAGAADTAEYGVSSAAAAEGDCTRLRRRLQIRQRYAATTVLQSPYRKRAGGHVFGSAVAAERTEDIFLKVLRQSNKNRSTIVVVAVAAIVELLK